jgi:putative membrane protein
MPFIFRFLLNGLAVWLTAYILDSVDIDGYVTALVVSLVLSLVNAFVKPVLIVLTIPITIVTLGLFYLVINALMIMLVDVIVPDFEVRGFAAALFFSLILYVFNSLIDDVTKDKKDDRD